MRDEPRVHKIPDIAVLLPTAVASWEQWGEDNSLAMDALEEQCSGGFALRRVQEFAAGRRCSRRALAQLGLADFPLLVGTDREPLWPPGFTGSITHTRHYCAAAACHTAQFASIGIDVEHIVDITPDLWPVFCSAAELAWLEGFPGRTRSAMAAVLFSGKEAFFKCQFPLTRQKPEFTAVALQLQEGTFTVSCWNMPDRIAFKGTYASLGSCGMIATAVVAVRATESAPYLTGRPARTGWRESLSPSFQGPCPQTP